MRFENERKLIVEYGKKLLTSGLTKGTGGNISVFRRSEGLMLISPSGLDYFKTLPEDVVVTDLSGSVVEGDRKPSSEYPMHSIFYRERDDINAVVHAHSPYCTTLSCLGWEMPSHHYLVALAGLNVRCAPYAPFGTEELAQSVLDGMEERYAVLMENHGMLAGAGTLELAFYIAEEMEFLAGVYYRAKCLGEPKLLTENEMQSLQQRFRGYGQQPRT